MNATVLQERIAEIVLTAVEEERQRIRRELLDAIGAKRTEWSLARPLGEEMVKNDREVGADVAFAVIVAALDKIAPEEESNG